MWYRVIGDVSIHPLKKRSATHVAGCFGMQKIGGVGRDDELHNFGNDVVCQFSYEVDVYMCMCCHSLNFLHIVCIGAFIIMLQNRMNCI